MATEELGLEIFVEGWQKFMSILDRMDKEVDKTGQTMTKTGGIAGGAFAVALGNVAASAAMKLVDALFDAARAVFEFGKSSIQMAADFQDQMAILQVAASSAGLSFDELHAAALGVGGDIRLMGVSATGAADAMTGLYKAGLTTTEIFGDLNAYMNEGAELGGALRASIDLAAASELDMAGAADLAAVALAAFGGEMETEAERAEFINEALNNFVQAADASVAEVSGLVEALKMVAPTAGSMGISIQEVNNALAVLSTRGIQGSMAGTSLNRMLLDLTKTTPKATEALEELGISIYDAEGAMLPLVDIIGQFETALEGATDAERDAALQAIFTAQGARAMNTLLVEGTQGWNDMAAATANAATIQEQAAIRSQTFNAQMEALEGTIETLKITIGEYFLPVLTELATWFAQMVDEHGPELQAVFGLIAEAFTDLIRGVMSFISVLSETGDPLQAFAEAMTYAIGEESPSMQSVWDAMSILGQVFDTVWNFILELVGEAVRWFQANLPLIQEASQQIVDWWQTIFVPVVDNVWNIIKEIVSTSMDVILNVITLVMQIITGDWEGAWATIKEIVVEITATVLAIIEEIMEATANVMGTTMDEIRATWASNWEMAKIIVTQTWANIQDTITRTLVNIINTVKQKIADTVEAIRSFTDDFRAVGQDLVDSLKAGIMSKVQSIIDAVKDLIRRAIEAAREALQMESPTSRPFRLMGQGISASIARGVAQLAPAVQAEVSAVVTAPARASGTTTNTSSVVNNYNLTTQSTTRAGGLAMEFGAMAFAGAGASR